MRTSGTTILLAVPDQNCFFTEHVVRHFQRHTPDSVELLLITNDDTSAPVRTLVRFLAEHPRIRVHHAEGCRDRPIGQSIDSALRSDTRLHERLLFTHIDLFYIEPEFWRCEALNNGVRMVSGRFVQEPLWLDGHSEPIPRPADDHILIDTEFYRNNGLVFRAYAKAGDAFAEAAWLADALPRFRRAGGDPIGPDYPLDPFNLSHLKIALSHGADCARLWRHHFPRQVHFNSILRALHWGVKRFPDGSGERIMVPLSARRENAGYHWRTLIRYAIVSSDFFNPLVDYVVPFQAVWREDPQECERELGRLSGGLEFLRGVAGPLPYRVVGRWDPRHVRIGWWDDNE
jgi:hypothetical protein